MDTRSVAAGYGYKVPTKHGAVHIRVANSRSSLAWPHQLNGTAGKRAGTSVNVLLLQKDIGANAPMSFTLKPVIHLYQQRGADAGTSPVVS